MQGRYAHLNLRWNPFGEATPEERADLALVDYHAFDSLLKPGVALELRADHGRGKSTTLWGLRKKYAPQAPHIRGSFLGKQKLPIADWVFLDEVQQIPLLRLWRFARAMAQRKGIIVYSTHQNRLWLFKNAGFSPKKIQIDYTQPQHLHALFHRRLQWARRAQGEIPALTLQDVTQLKNQFGSDVRSMEHHLYWCINQLKNPSQKIICGDLP